MITRSIKKSEKKWIVAMRSVSRVRENKRVWREVLKSGLVGRCWGSTEGYVLKALVEMSSALLRVEINSFITLCSCHYHRRMAFLQGIDATAARLLQPYSCTETGIRTGDTC